MANEIESRNTNQIAEQLKQVTGILNQLVEPIEENTKDIKELGKRMDKFEKSQRIDYAASSNIARHVHSRVHTLLGGSTSIDYVKYGRTFICRLWSSLKQRFDVTSYHNIREVDYEIAINYIDEWFPENGVEALKHDIDVIKAIQMKDKIDTIAQVAGGAV